MAKKKAAPRKAAALELKQDPKNANEHNDQSRAAVGQSLAELGAGRSIVVDKTGTVIGGNATLEKAKELGIGLEYVHTRGDKLVVVVRDDLDTDDPKRKALAIADNRTAEFSDWNPITLDELWKSIPPELQATAGFDESQIQKMLDDMADQADAAGEDVDIPDAWQIVVECKGEDDQRALFEQLTGDGYTCRAITL